MVYLLAGGHPSYAVGGPEEVAGGLIRDLMSVAKVPPFLKGERRQGQGTMTDRMQSSAFVVEASNVEHGNGRHGERCLSSTLRIVISPPFGRRRQPPPNVPSSQLGYCAGA